MVSAGRVFSWAFLTLALLLIIFAVVAIYVYIFIIPQLQSSLGNYVLEKVDAVQVVYSSQQLTSDFINCAAGFP